jgi:hypothetical protein
MSAVFGYGEDALTLWTLKQPIEILKKFYDNTPPSDCLAFYRPSFGRRGGFGRKQFGEFDAILASKQNVYLIESKWDNHAGASKQELLLADRQTIRHKVFRWYLNNWSSKYLGDWDTFVRDKERDFINGKSMACEGDLLEQNLEEILRRLNEHCPNCQSGNHVKNVLLFFYSTAQPLKAPPENFTIIPIKYDVQSNYVPLV